MFINGKYIWLKLVKFKFKDLFNVMCKVYVILCEILIMEIFEISCMIGLM